ncbi:MAG: hypothetical protein IT529_07980, partial [Burkholderiales bacterium]|nr:hypothetical protein [Burkholderiales bacterium]
FTDNGSFRNNAGALVFNNAGTAVKSGSSGASPLGVPATSFFGTFTNAASGVINANSGTLTFTNGLGTNTGTINVAGGAMLSTGNNSFTNAGTIQGSGTLLLTAGTTVTTGRTLTSSGTINAGASPGTLNITGDLVLTPANVTHIEILNGGAVPGTDFDVINVSGTATLGGTLTIAHLGSLVPAANQTFQVLNAGALANTFGTVAPPPGSAYTALYNNPGAGNVTLRADTAALLNEWIRDSAASEFWNVGTFWSLGHAPQAGEAVRLDRAGFTGTVIVNSAGQVAGQVFSTENITVDTGGVLTLSGTGTVNAVLGIQGTGTLTNNGPLAVTNLGLSGGTLNGTGSVSVTNSYSQTGGAVNIGGAANITQAAGALALGQITAASITATAQAGSIAVNGGLSSPGNITLAAQGGSSDVTVSAGITGTGAAGNTLTVQAANSILFNTGASVGATNALNVVLNSDRDASGAGAIALGSGTIITSNGGTITLGGGITPETGAARGTATNIEGIRLDNVQLVSGAGSITVRGQGVDATSFASGINIAGGSAIESSSGSVSLNGRGGAGSSQNTGVRIADAGTRVTSTGAGAININGNNTGVVNSAGNNYGIAVGLGAVVESTATSGGGSVTLTGTGGNGTADNYGIYINTAGTRVSSASGSILLTGTGGASGGGSRNMGVQIINNGMVGSTTTGAVTIGGTGGSGQDHAVGVNFEAGGRATSADGNILVTGQGGSGGNNSHIGTRILGGAVTATGMGAITINGTGGSASNVDLFGVTVEASGLVSVVNGNITITGTGGSGTGTNHAGVYLNSGGQILSTGAGNIGIVGTGTNGAPGILFANNLGAGTNTVGGATANGSIGLTSQSGSGISLGGNNAVIRTGATRAVTLNAVGGGGVSQTSGSITAGGLRFLGSGTFIVDQAGNDVTTLAADFVGPGSVSYRDANAVAIGTVLGLPGITLPAAAGNTVTINAGGDIAFNAGNITAGAVTLNAGAGSIVNNVGSGAQIVTSGANGAIGLAGAAIGAAGAGRIGVNPGTGSVSSTTGGGIFLEHTAGDLVSSRYTANTGAGVATYSLATTDGRIVVDNASAWNSDDHIVLATAGASRNIEFTGSGTFTAASLTLNGTGAASFGGPNVNFAAPVTANLPVSITAGSANFNGTSTLGDFSLGGGTLGGSGAVTVTSSMNWSGGVQSGSGSTTVAPAAAFTISGSPILLGRTFATHSTAGQWTGNGVIDIAQSAFTNSGTLTATGDGQIRNGTSTMSGGAFINSGLFVKNSGAGTTSILETANPLAVSNTGTLDIRTGSMAINTGTGTTFSTPGTITLKGTGAADTLAISGNLTLASSSVINTELNGTGAGQYGRISVTGAASLNGTLNVAHAVGFTPSGGDSFQIVTHGSRTGDFATRNLPAGFGYTTLPGATAYVLSLGPLVKEWIFDGDGFWDEASKWSGNTVPVAGDTVQIDRPGAGNTFTVTVRSGAQIAGTLSMAGDERLAITGGGLTLAGGSSSISDTLAMSGGALVNNGSLTAGTLDFSGGAISGSGGLSITGAFNWSGGNVSGAGAPISTAGTTTISGVVGLSSKTWNNAGTIIVSGGGSLQMAAAAVLANQPAGVVNLTGTHAAPIAAAGSATVNNAGTINKTSAGAQSIQNQFNNTGTVNVAAGSLNVATGGADTTSRYDVAGGAALQFNSGLLHVADITGGGSVNFAGATVFLDSGFGLATTGTVTISGASVQPQVPVTFGGPLTVSGGLLLGTGAVTVNGPFTWSGGTTVGGTLLTTAGATTITTATGGTGNWSNAGTVTIAGAGAVQLGAGATFTNQPGGVLNLTGTSAVPIGTNGAARNIVNAGTINKDSPGTQNTGINTFRNDGRVNVNAGVLELGTGATDTGAYAVAAGAELKLSGGTRILAAGSDVTGSGRANFTGATVTINGGFGIASTGTTVIGAGSVGSNVALTFDGPVAVTGGQFVSTAATNVNGSFDWSGGSLSGAGPLVTAGATGITGAVGIANKAWSNTGTLTIAGAGAVTQSGGATLTNQAAGVINLTGTAATPIGHAAGVMQVFNAGTFNKSGTSAQTIDNAFGNTGTVNVTGGSLTVNGFAGNTNSGVLNLSNGATLAATVNSTPASFTNASTATLSGSGTVSVGAGNTLTNQGTIRAGNSPGTLNIGGSLALTSSSVTHIELQAPGTGAGTDYDVIDVSGAVTLGGALNVSHLGGFTPVGGSTFQIMNYASRTGDFGVKNFPPTFNYATLANPANYVLSMDSQTNTWRALSGDWGTTPGALSPNWSLGHVPTAGEVVVIPDVGTPGVVDHTITVSAAGQVAKSVTNAETLQIASGDLLFTGASTSSGVLAISGGTLTADGNLTATTLNLSGGGLRGGGTVTVTGALAWNGPGQISAAGLTLPAGSTANITGAGARTVDATVIDNAGAITYAAPASSFQLQNGAIISNRSGARFEIQGDLFVNAAPGNGTFNNSGLLLKSTGTGSGGLGASVTFNNSGGTLNGQSGSLQIFGGGSHTGTLALASGGNELAGGTHDFAAGSTITGAGNLRVTGGTVNVNGGYDAAGTIVSGTGTLNVNRAGATTDALSLFGGTLGGSGGLTVTGSWQYATGANLDTVLTLGAAAGATLSGVTVTGAGSIRNLGTLAVADSTLSVPVVNSSPVSFSGTNTFTSGAGVSGGTVNFTGGTTTFHAGSTYGVATTNVGGGAIASFGNLATTGALDLNGGTVAGAGSLTVAGAWSYVAGNVDVSMVLGSGANSTLSNVTVTGSGNLTNLGRLELNAATVVPVFVNQGTVATATGTANAINATANAGVMALAAGSSLAVPGALDNTGMIRGDGTLVLGGGVETLTNNGWIAPGASPGALVIGGHLVQGAGGNLAIEVGGPVPGVSHDVLRVTGTTSLGGNLHLTLSGGYLPADGASFGIVNYASSTGNFGLGSVPADYTVRGSLGGNQYSIAFFGVGGAVAEPPPPPVVPQAVVEVSSNVLVRETAALASLTGVGAPGGSGAAAAPGEPGEPEARRSAPASTTQSRQSGGQGTGQPSRRPPVCR